jgi:hypothetical protein
VTILHDIAAWVEDHSASNQMDLTDVRDRTEPVTCTGWTDYRHKEHAMELVKTSGHPVAASYQCPSCRRKVRYRAGAYEDVIHRDVEYRGDKPG